MTVEDSRTAEGDVMGKLLFQMLPSIRGKYHLLQSTCTEMKPDPRGKWKRLQVPLNSRDFSEQFSWASGSQGANTELLLLCVCVHVSVCTLVCALHTCECVCDLVHTYTYLMASEF